MAVVKKNKVNLYGKNIEIIFKFLEEYKKEQFRTDVSNFFRFYTDRMTREEKTQFEIEYGGLESKDEYSEFRRYKEINKQIVESKRLPSFDDYVNEISRLFYAYILRLAGDFAKRNQIPDGLKMIIYIMNGHKREFYGGHEDPFFPNLERLKTSCPGLIVYGLNGTLLFYKIFSPFYYIRRFEVSHLVKLLTHEFQHYIHFIEGRYEKEKFLRDRYEGLNFEHLTILNELFWDMLNDGTAESSERPYQQLILLKGMNLLKQFKSRVIYLAYQTDYGAAQEYYEKKIDTSAQKYYWARMMAFTIMVEIAVEKRKPSFFTFYRGFKRIYIGVGEMQDKFRELWGSKEPIKMENIPLEVLGYAEKVFESIRTYKEFIELYERACDFFGIPSGNRILTNKFVRELFKIEVKQVKKQTESIERQIDELMEI